MKKNRLAMGILTFLIMVVGAYIVATTSFLSCSSYLVWRTLIALGALAAITHLIAAFLKDKDL